MKLKTLIFQCPPLPALSAYQNALGIVDGVVSPYSPYYDLEFGLEDGSYPVFLPDGRIQLKVNPKKYTRVIESNGGDPAFKDFWNGVYREVRLARVGFEVSVVDIRAPLKLLFERIASIQASTVFQDGNYQTIKCWDSVRIEPANFEDGSMVTERDGAIMVVSGGEEGMYGPTQRPINCSSQETVPDLLYSQVFTIRFMEAVPRLIQ